MENLKMEKLMEFASNKFMIKINKLKKNIQMDLCLKLLPT